MRKTLTWRDQPCHEVHLECPECGHTRHVQPGGTAPRLCTQKRGPRRCNTPFVVMDHQRVAGVCVCNKSHSARMMLGQLDPRTWPQSIPQEGMTP